MKRALLLAILCIFRALIPIAHAHPQDHTTNDSIRSAAAQGNPIIIANILDSRLIARGMRSEQIDYKIQVTRVLSGSRNPWLDSVAHYSNGALEARPWHRGWTYLFVFDSPATTMPLYSEPLSRFGKRKGQIIELIEHAKAGQNKDGQSKPGDRWFPSSCRPRGAAMLNRCKRNTPYAEA